MDAIGGYVKQYHVQPDPMKLVALRADVRRRDRGAGEEQRQHRRRLHRAQGRVVPRPRGRPDRERPSRSRASSSATRNGTPIYIRDVAAVGIGRELRTGSASENGEEVVVGTALMLIGANSRTVAARCGREDRRGATRRCRRTSARSRCSTARSSWTPTIGTVAQEPGRGRDPGHRRALRSCSATSARRFITALAIPLSMLMTATGMVQTASAAT